jgi:serine/threonine protein kinase
LESALSFTAEHPNPEQLSAFLLGQLTEAERAALAAHIEMCDLCCQALREIPDDAFTARIREANASASSDMDGSPARSRRDQPLPKELLEHPRYQIGRFLGSGGMGAVYQAEHRLMDRVVALKIIHRDLSRHPRVLDRFRKEVKAAGKLQHPNIVTAYDAEQAGDLHFLVMEFVDGVSLAQLITRKGPLEIATACNFIRQAARGLQHAFEAGMVHRDIKPHNLMLTRKGQIKILDFGLARMASESLADLALPDAEGDPGRTRVGEIMGTPDFMAPEQIIDPTQADIRADLYSLGCTLYYLLCGRSPFWNEAGRVALTSKKYRPPRPITDLRADLPAELVAVINKMLAKDPAQRYQTPAEFMKPLAPFMKGAPTAATQPAAVDTRTTPVPPTLSPATKEMPRVQLPGFLTQCPFCKVRTRVPDKARGASVRCPSCSSFFTVAPEDEETR